MAAWSGGGSGTFYYLHILDAASAGALDEDGSAYSRLNLTMVRTYILGDRWHGDVSLIGLKIPEAATVRARRANVTKPSRSVIMCKMGVRVT